MRRSQLYHHTLRLALKLNLQVKSTSLVAKHTSGVAGLPSAVVSHGSHTGPLQGGGLDAASPNDVPSPEEVMSSDEPCCLSLPDKQAAGCTSGGAGLPSAVVSHGSHTGLL